MEERRREPRYPIRVPAHILVGNAELLYKGYVVNLSSSGLLASLSVGFADAGRSMQMQFVIEPDTKCVASGHITHVATLESGQAFGAHFSQYNRNYANFLGALAVASKRELQSYINRITRIVIRIA